MDCKNPCSLGSMIKRILFILSISSTSAMAGVFDLPSFLEPGQFSAGLEGDFALTNGTGAALNLKPRYGISDFFNVQAIVGTGAGDRKFRAGATLDLEIFPDLNWQPGIAIPATFLYTRKKHDGIASLYISPMIYKTFLGKDGLSFTPFFSVPLGWHANGGTLNGFSQIALGTMFSPQNMKYFKFTVEAGFNIHESYTYLSGGVTYYMGGYVNRGSDTTPSDEGSGPAIAPGQSISPEATVNKKQ